MTSVLIYDKIREENGSSYHRRNNILQHNVNLGYNSNHEPHDTRYYVSSYIAGGLSSSIRWVLSPLELVKTKMQVTGDGMSATFRIVHAEEGILGLFRGLSPTAMAYWFQTSTKYGLYEVLKDKYTHSAMEFTGLSKKDIQNKYQGMIYVSAAASAEFVADILMCPFEMIKVKVQTAPNFPNKFTPALSYMIQHRQQYNFPFGSLPPLWARQIPATIVNFYTFENSVRFLYKQLGGNKEDYTQYEQLAVTFTAGYMAGFCATIISQPADSLVSLMTLPQYRGKSIYTIIQEVGLYTLATRGLGPRIMVTGSIISGQWLLYDTFKSIFGYETSG